MNRRTFLAMGGGAALTPIAVSSAQKPRPSKKARHVLEAAFSFGMGGGYDSKWGGSGVPEAIEHKGTRILSKATNGTYCCGFTFAVCTKILAGSKAWRAKSAADVKAFQQAWYGANKASSERQCAYAVETFQLGKEVEAKDALAGDFVQLWRKTKKPSGHSVLFLSWIELEGERIGIHYLSSQGSTKGIGFGTEFFSGAGLPGARVDPDRIYAARL